MTASFDLTILPLHRLRGQELAQMPGLLATSTPKRPARGREADVLILHLTLAGNAPVSSAEYNQITVQMAQRFYQVPGALTSAIRTTAEVLNQYLIERNQRINAKGQYIIGRMILGVLRGGQLTLAQCGPTQVYHLHGGGRSPIRDLNLSGRGLGIGQSIPLHLAQCEVKDGDRLVLCTHTPAEWQEDLPPTEATSLEELRQGLSDATEADLDCAVVGLQAGRGAISILRSTPRPRPAAQEKAATTKVTETITAPADEPAGQAMEASPEQGNGEEDKPALTAKEQTVTRLDLQHPGRFVRPLTPKAAAPAEATPTATPVTMAASPQKREGESALQEAAEIPTIARAADSEHRRRTYLKLADGMQQTRSFFERLSARGQEMLARLLPKAAESSEERRNPFLLFIAIAIPLVLVTAAVMIYLKYGQMGQYKANYDLAVGAAVQAINESDPTAVQIAWESTLFYLDKAERYKVTDESEALRQQAEAALDAMDLIIRLDFRPAIYGGLESDVRITHMAATGAGLYLLDANSGSILMTTQSALGYQSEANFQCTPGEYPNPEDEDKVVSVGALIDMAVMPGGNDQNATVVGMDANGHLLFCAPGRQGQAFLLETPPLERGRLLGFTMSANGKEMYVLDEKGIWIYSYIQFELGRDENDQAVLTEDKNYYYPVAFFSGERPANLASAVDLAANGSDMFLLFADSHVSVCTYSDIADQPSVCQDPATFTDPRPGHHSGWRISDALFNQVLFDTPYNTALYLLEPRTHAIFMVAPHPTSLELIGQMHADREMERDIFRSAPATVMAIDGNRNLYVCIGNQVYYAAMP